MSDCPIGLICELMVCDRSICHEWARPWPLPYITEIFNDKFNKFESGIKVSVWEEEWTDTNLEHEIINEERENRWINLIRERCFLAGWINAIELPYEYRDGLYVLFDLHLDESIIYSCPINRFQGSYEGFYKAIPLNSSKHSWWYETKEKDEFGFYNRLAWHDSFWVSDQDSDD